MTESPDNLAAAVDAVGTDLGKTPTGDKASQVLIRAPKESHERWKRAAEAHGVSMSEFVRAAADEAAAAILDCPHGVQHRRWYPWAEVCLHCGLQLRDGKKWLVDPASVPQVRPDGANPAVQG